MRSRFAFGLAFALTSAVAACSSATSAIDAASDDAFVPSDAGANDASSPPDAVVTSDAASPIDAAPDAFVNDVGTDAPPAHDAASSDAGSTGCAACGAGMSCAYAIADGCSAAPTCVTIPMGSPCGAIILEQGCGCDGSLVTWRGGCHPELPTGYAPAPIVHMGPCT